MQPDSFAELQKRVDGVQWYHDIDFPNGLIARTKSPDAGSHRKLWEWMRSELDKSDFRGKTVLDMGCWDGMWSFYAESRGAARVLAADDSTQNWSANAGLRLAKEIGGGSFETRTDVSIYEASKVGERFDIVLCLGVYYHLVDAFYAFGQLRKCCKSLLIVEGDYAPDWFVQPDQAAYLDMGNPSRCFVPSIKYLKQLLEANYFHVLTESFYHGQADKPVNRVFLTCEPFEGENPMYCSKPPFGLAQFDTRFNR